MGLRMKNFNIVGIQWKIPFMGGGGVGQGDLDSLQIYDGAWQKGDEWCFWGGEGIWYPMHTMVNYLTLCSI